MSQKVVIVARKNPTDPDLDPKYYGLAKSRGKISMKQICDRIAERSSYSKGELEGCITEFLLETLHVLQEGNIAQMGDMGNFRLAVTTKAAAEKRESFTVANLGDAKVHFWPGALLRKLCKSMDYSIEKPQSEQQPTEPTEPIV